MKQLIAVIALLTAASTAALCDDDRNGRNWKQFTPEMKLFYVAGYLDGIRDGSTLAYVAQKKDAAVATKFAGYLVSLYAGKATRGEIVEALDLFYKDPANALVWISFGMGYSAARATGEDMTTWDKDLQDQRRAMAGSPPVTQLPVATQ